MLPFLQQASSAAGKVDSVFLFILVLCIAFLVFITQQDSPIFALTINYRFGLNKFDAFIFRVSEKLLIIFSEGPSIYIKYIDIYKIYKSI